MTRPEKQNPAGGPGSASAFAGSGMQWSDHTPNLPGDRRESPATERPLDFTDASGRRDAGMASSAGHADQDAPGWSDRAYDFLCRYVAAEPAPFTIEQFRAWAVHAGLDRPAEERAYGAVTQRALRQDLIVKVGYASTASSNGSVKPLYACPSREVAA